MQLQPYQAPQVGLLVLLCDQRILELSDYGDTGEAGTGFYDDSIIDFPILF